MNKEKESSSMKKVVIFPVILGVRLKQGYHGMVGLNCTSYMAGVKNVWRTNKSATIDSNQNFKTNQTFNDGKI